jgi:hypothetical protein
MLDEAELRVKQVSDKTMKAGAASLSDLSNHDKGDEPVIQGLVAVEIESFESTFDLIDPPAVKQSAASQSAQPSPAGKSQPAQQPAAQPLLDELDPLFDDED